VRRDGFTLDRVGKRIEVPYSDLKAVGFSSLAYTGGWFTLKLKSGKRYKFTVVLERSDLLLDAVFAARPDICPEKKFHAYRRTSIFSDQSWSRLYERARQWFRLILKYVVLAPAAGAAIGFLLSQNLEPKVAWCLGGAAAGFCFYYGIFLFMASEYWMAWHLKGVLKRDPSAIQRDLAYERKIQSVVGWLFYLTVSGVVVAAAIVAYL